MLSASLNKTFPSFHSYLPLYLPNSILILFFKCRFSQLESRLVSDNRLWNCNWLQTLIQVTAFLGVVPQCLASPLLIGRVCVCVCVWGELYLTFRYCNLAYHPCINDPSIHPSIHPYLYNYQILYLSGFFKCRFSQLPIDNLNSYNKYW